MKGERSVTVFSGGGTGGHLYPALALADALVRIRPDVHPHFVGAARGVESRVLPGRGVAHTLLPVEAFRRDGLRPNVPVLRALLQALVALASLFEELRPRLVVVTGGYAGGAAGIMAGLMRIRLVIQEQNAFPGLTSRVLSLWAHEVHVAFPEAREAFPRLARRKARVSGNPVQPPRPIPRDRAMAHFDLETGARVVLVVGGSQGSRALNRALLGVVEGVCRGDLERPADLRLLWATGPDHEEEVAGRLAASGKVGWVRALGYIEEMPRALAAAELAVSRAGAMATSEFLAWGLPSILVPLPTAAADHQSRNAEALAAAGAAIHLPEAELTPSRLWGEVLQVLAGEGRLQAMGSAARERGRPHAAEEIARSLARQLPPGPSSPSEPWRGP